MIFYQSCRYFTRKKKIFFPLFNPSETQESLERSERRRERWEQKQHRKRRIKQRSISKEKWVETLVVADTKMIEYHGSENIEKYVLTVMNMVSPPSSQEQSHQVPGDVAMTHAEHWPCQDSSLVGPQQSSHQAGCSRPVLAFLHCSGSQPPREDGSVSGRSSSACSAYTFPAGSRLLPSASRHGDGKCGLPGRDLEGRDAPGRGGGRCCPGLCPSGSPREMGPRDTAEAEPPQSLHGGHPPSSVC